MIAAHEGLTEDEKAEVLSDDRADRNAQLERENDKLGELVTKLKAERDQLQAERDGYKSIANSVATDMAELRAAARECERARLAGDHLTATLQGSVLVQMLLASEREQRRAELPQVPESLDLGLKAAAAALSSLTASDNDDGRGAA